MEPNNPLAGPTLRDFLFNNESLESIKPTTKALGDTALVLIRPVYIGKLCQTFDEAEDIFHVEYASNIDKTWAEIWISKEWKESNARRNRSQVRSSQERQTREVRNKRISEIKAQLISCGMDKKPGFVEHLASQILDSWKQGNYNELLRLLKLTDKLQNYDKEDNETTERTKQVEYDLQGHIVSGTGENVKGSSESPATGSDFGETNHAATHVDPEDD